MSDDLKLVHQILTTIPVVADLAVDAYTVTRLGGLTNLVFLIDTGNDRYVLRIPGKGTEEYINREVEIHNARIAAQAGVSADVIYADTQTGVMLTRHIDGIVTMTPDEFGRREGAAARAGRALKKMHEWPEAFEFRFELFSMIDEYLAILDERKAELPEGYTAVVESAQPVRAALERSPVKLAPCHCDPLCENFLDSGERMWVVDWEYSGMNDPPRSQSGSFMPEYSQSTIHMRAPSSRKFSHKGSQWQGASAAWCAASAWRAGWAAATTLA